MKTIEPELERRLAELRSVAQPAGGDKRRILDSVRAALEAPTAAPPATSALKSDVPERRLPSDRDPRAPSASSVRALFPWLGGALIGAALGLLLGFGWGRAGRTRAAQETHPASIAPAALVVPLSTLTVSAAGGDAAPATSSVTLSPKASPSESPVLNPATLASMSDADADAAQTQRVGIRPGESRPSARAHRRHTAREQPLDLERVLELLHRAERALHASEPELALALLGELDQHAPRALLRQERLTTLTLALCQLERPAEARAARDELQREFGGSIYASRLERSCAASGGVNGSR